MLSLSLDSWGSLRFLTFVGKNFISQIQEEHGGECRTKPFLVFKIIIPGIVFRSSNEGDMPNCHRTSFRPERCEILRFSHFP
jgi:hypothetical protein